MTTLSRYESAFAPLYFRNVVSAYNNMPKTRQNLSCVSDIVKFCFIHGRVYERFIRSISIARGAKAMKTYRRPRDSSRKTQTIRCRLTNRGNETIPEKRNRYSPVGCVAKKNIPPRLSRCMKYISRHTGGGGGGGVTRAALSQVFHS